MDTLKSAIFLHHPGAKRALKMKRFFSALTVLGIILLVFVFTMLMIAWVVGVKERELGPFIMILITSSVGATALYHGLDKGWQQTFNIEVGVGCLGKLLGMIEGAILSQKPETIRQRGKEALVIAALDLEWKRKEVAAVKKAIANIGVSPALSKRAFAAMEAELKEVDERINLLYDTLLEFGLTEPGGFGWAFKEAREAMAEE